MTDTRYSAEDLRHAAAAIYIAVYKHVADQVSPMLKQAANDAETLAGIRAWLERESKKRPTDDSIANAWANCADWALDELNRLSRGDA